MFRMSVLKQFHLLIIHCMQTRETLAPPWPIGPFRFCAFFFVFLFVGGRQSTLNNQSTVLDWTAWPSRVHLFINMRDALSFLVICVLCLLPKIYSVLNIQRIENCVKESVSTTTKYRNKNGMFSLHYGDAGLEVFNSIHSAEIKQIHVLAKCVQFEDHSTFVARFAVFMHSKWFFKKYNSII